MIITKKTDKLLEEILYCDLRTDIGIDKAKKAIRLALKEQNRAAINRCADECQALAERKGHARNGKLCQYAEHLRKL